MASKALVGGVAGLATAGGLLVFGVGIAVALFAAVVVGGVLAMIVGNAHAAGTDSDSDGGSFSSSSSDSSGSDWSSSSDSCSSDSGGSDGGGGD